MMMVAFLSQIHSTWSGENFGYYNYSMGHVDLSDLLCDQYRFGKWKRKRKLWPPIKFWGFQVLLMSSLL